MKSTILFTAATLCLAACSNPKEPSAANFAPGLHAYLAKRGALCLAKAEWPVDVAAAEFASGATRNAVQMPVLEKLGVVAGADIDDGGRHVRRYRLTEAGKRWYLPREPRAQPPFGAERASHDLCAAKLSLDRVVGWEKSARPDDGANAVVVSYTYKVDAAPWAANADAQRVFPMVARVIGGAGAMQLQETFERGERGWVAKDL